MDPRGGVAEVERRLLGGPAAHVRLAAGGRTITGYAAVYNSLSEDLGGFREVLRPGAFDRAVRERQAVVALFNHDDSAILGRTSNGTLELSVDSRGLLVGIKPPDTATAREVLTLVRGGYVDGMSFAFRVPRAEGQSWSELPGGGGLLREVFDLDLFDVSVVTRPAYEATSVGVRSRPGPSVEVLRLRLRLSMLR